MATTKSTSKPAPSLKDILAASADKAKAAEEAAAALLAEAASEQEAFDAALEVAVAPYREVRDAQFATIAEAKATIAEVTAPIIEAHEKRVAKANADFEAKMDAAQAGLLDTIEKAQAAIAANEVAFETEQDIPAVFLNQDLAPAPAPKKAKSSGSTVSKAKAPKVASLGVLGPVLVTAPHRYPQLDPTQPTSVVYEVKSVDSELVLFGKRVDHVVNGKRVISQELIDDGDYTNFDTKASAVASATGWHSTKDAMFVLATAAGILGDFPEFAAESDASDLFLNGQPLAATPTAHEAVTIEETV